MSWNRNYSGTKAAVLAALASGAAEVKASGVPEFEHAGVDHQYAAATAAVTEVVPETAGTTCSVSLGGHGYRTEGGNEEASVFGGLSYTVPAEAERPSTDGPAEDHAPAPGGETPTTG